jgi:hypothetical protein
MLCVVFDAPNEGGVPKFNFVVPPVPLGSTFEKGEDWKGGGGGSNATEGCEFLFQIAIPTMRKLQLIGTTKRHILQLEETADKTFVVRGAFPAHRVEMKVWVGGGGLMF